jgi:hypothetical protein
MGGTFLATCMALVASVLTGLGVFWGLHGVLAAEGGPAAWLIPLGAAIAIGCLLGAAWHYVLGMARYARSAGAIALVLAMGVLLTGISIATSAWWLTSALGGGMALRHHHQIQFENYVAALDGMQSQARVDRKLLLEIATTRNILQQALDDERRDGSITGKTGSGPVVRELQVMLNALDDHHAALAKIPDEREALVARARTAIDEARRASAGGDETGVARALGETSHFITEAAGLDMVYQASAIPATLNSGQPPVRSAVDHLRPAISDALRDRVPVAVPHYQPTTRAAAVLDHAAHVAAAWAVAIALDCLVLALLCVLLVRANLDRTVPPDNRVALPDDRTGPFDSSDGDVRPFRPLNRAG